MTVPTNVYQINVDQYASLSEPFQCFDGNGNIVDITGYTADLDVIDSNGNVLFIMSTGNGRITDGGTNGVFTLVLAASVWATVPPLVAPGNYRYDWLVTDGAGFKFRMAQGAFQVNPGITPS